LSVHFSGLFALDLVDPDVLPTQVKLGKSRQIAAKEMTFHFRQISQGD
jgi:hypothetical protein